MPSGKLFECGSGSLVHSFAVNAGAMRACFSADGKRLLISAPWSAVPGLQVWNLESGTVERAYYGHETGGEASFSPDGQTVLVGGQLLSVSTGELLHVFEGRGRTAVTSDGRMAVTETFSNKAALWDLATKQLIRTFECPAAETTGLALSADGRLLAITGSRNVQEPPAVALLYALDNGTLVRTIDIPGASPHVVSMLDRKHLLITRTKRWPIGNFKMISEKKNEDRTIKKMMIFGAEVDILMDLGRLIPAYAPDPITVTSRTIFRSA